MSGLISVISHTGTFGSGSGEIVVQDQNGLSYYFTEGGAGGNFNTTTNGIPMFVLGNSSPTIGEIYVAGTVGSGMIRGSSVSGNPTYNQPLGGMSAGVANGNCFQNIDASPQNYEFDNDSSRLPNANQTINDFATNSSNYGRIIMDPTNPNGIWEFGTTNCCLHADTIIETDSGMKKISEIVAGDKVKHMNGKLMNVKFNLKFCKTNKFIKLPTDCFGENTPNKDTFIVDGHPIFVDGKEVQPRDFLSKNGVEEVLLDNYVNVYSLCTDERTFFKVNGDLAVCTWEENECAEKYGYTYWKQ
ncbi:MAG: hypothetical protein GTN36_05290 [Candidatus Aenigmarchaeota archaeon]|nr:hypothetical protein [Candidatus Aenigmarchaeota archaeon]